MSVIKLTDDVKLSTDSIDGILGFNPANVLADINLTKDNYFFTNDYDCYLRFEHYHNNTSWTGIKVNNVGVISNYNTNSGYTTQYYGIIPYKRGQTVTRWNEIHYDGTVNVKAFALARKGTLDG